MPRPRRPSRRAVRARAEDDARGNRPLLLLMASAFLLAGLALAIWSVQEIRSLVGSLQSAAPVVETMSGTYALPVLALAALALGGLLAVETASRPLAERMGAAFLLLAFGGTVLACLLGLAGGFVNSAVMARHGYEACETRMGTRLSWTTWALAPGGCPAPPAP